MGVDPLHFCSACSTTSGSVVTAVTVGVTLPLGASISSMLASWIACPTSSEALRAQPFSETLGELGQLLGSEENQNDSENHHQFGGSESEDRTLQHGRLLSGSIRQGGTQPQAAIAGITRGSIAEDDPSTPFSIHFAQHKR